MGFNLAFKGLMPLQQARNQTVNCRAATSQPQAKLKFKKKKN
jgi:hypothetical protein